MQIAINIFKAHAEHVAVRRILRHDNPDPALL